MNTDLQVPAHWYDSISLAALGGTPWRWPGSGIA